MMHKLGSLRGRHAVTRSIRLTEWYMPNYRQVHQRFPASRSGPWFQGDPPLRTSRSQPQAVAPRSLACGPFDTRLATDTHRSGRSLLRPSQQSRPMPLCSLWTWTQAHLFRVGANIPAMAISFIQYAFPPRRIPGITDLPKVQPNMVYPSRHAH
jgi:hypothetical protein